MLFKYISLCGFPTFNKYQTNNNMVARYLAEDFCLPLINFQIISSRKIFDLISP